MSRAKTFAASMPKREPAKEAPDLQPSAGQPPCCMRRRCAAPRSNSWFPTPLKSRPARFIASIVGSSSNAADASGDAPKRSPAETKAKLGLRARRRPTSVASRATPPARTLAPPTVTLSVGGSRLPWKSLIAAMVTLTGCCAEAAQASGKTSASRHCESFTFASDASSRECSGRARAAGSCRARRRGTSSATISRPRSAPFRSRPPRRPCPSAVCRTC